MKHITTTTAWNMLTDCAQMAIYDAYMAAHNEDLSFDDFNRMCAGLTTKGIEMLW